MGIRNMWVLSTLIKIVMFVMFSWPTFSWSTSSRNAPRDWCSTLLMKEHWLGYNKVCRINNNEIQENIIKNNLFIETKASNVNFLPSIKTYVIVCYDIDVSDLARVVDAGFLPDQIRISGSIRAHCGGRLKKWLITLFYKSCGRWKLTFQTAWNQLCADNL